MLCLFLYNSYKSCGAEQPHGALNRSCKGRGRLPRRKKCALSGPAEPQTAKNNPFAGRCTQDPEGYGAEAAGVGRYGTRTRPIVTLAIRGDTSQPGL